MIPIARPLLGKEEIDAVTEVLSSGMIAQGPKVEEFELAFSEYTGCEYAAAVNSGTAALHIALLAHDIGKEDEVITSPFTFIATANSILYTGAKPVFADIEPDTYNIDPEKIKEKINPKTKAIMPVHLYGQSADMKAIMEIAEDHKLVVIEDACQAHGAECLGKKAGSFGTGAFSFYPTKNMTTSEGGIITTSDREIAEKSKMIRAHGSRVRYLHEMLGFNLRMTDIAAAIGLAQLEKLDGFNASRQKNAAMLSEGLKSISGIVPATTREGYTHVFHQYTIRAQNRDKLADFLKEKGIGTGVHYPIPIHKQPYYMELGYKDSLPVSEKAAEEVLSLPVHPALSRDDVLKVIKEVKEFYASA
ncbi:DegT/DnrJ/EryC1/StrS family aminotransferase [Methanosarcina mazei]|jgi:dTDP-4-amino-4,6-dideoxygalactose transaminase|uniref:Aminotransferase DegT n=7 Tax=Methanosarcina mazei TaxID=2209 RepID=A0A0F8IJN8_METMZ|nr:DegT/DnrJ/EryC1/StrS family aminotransferase [Methanosarcina mazei]AGF96589.1 UDP-4-amino-4-deoxy-L-arabinose--oxoglutarate aminotransferase [Methanosarcina mazei Tuc01]AKB39149.1 UDP-4-amino-4-deoxy-L-arabinose--oxoglutarate aminotransferase [Methanosarcina mazei WWM610]AKB60144.1 UDP-4-amino-4-deoxy-L-arabinose--oxoglutarate aminotransferase [Methanosarcina mazei SarPi]AKB63347.1 UDP-4-amino-4-deoxy-L-arabinose--oxoglutarate aminotransferase [Methanosarcina mazei S-6]AKB66696.1 UDP-4-amin